MTLVRWQPWYEMETLRRQLDQLFDELAPVTRTSIAKVQRTWTPAIELQQTDDAVMLRAELPGIDAKDLDVQVSRTGVAIAGEYRSETKTEANQSFRSEFRYGSFRRVVALPVEVQNDQVTADFTNGILTLTLPKVTAIRPEVVKLNLGGEAPAPAVEEAPATEAPAQPAEQSDVWAESAQS